MVLKINGDGSLDLYVGESLSLRGIEDVVATGDGIKITGSSAQEEGQVTATMDSSISNLEVAPSSAEDLKRIMALVAHTAELSKSLTSAPSKSGKRPEGKTRTTSCDCNGAPHAHGPWVISLDTSRIEINCNTPTTKYRVNSTAMLSASEPIALAQLNALAAMNANENDGQETKEKAGDHDEEDSSDDDGDNKEMGDGGAMDVSGKDADEGKQGEADGAAMGLAGQSTAETSQGNEITCSQGKESKSGPARGRKRHRPETWSNLQGDGWTSCQATLSTSGYYYLRPGVSKANITVAGSSMVLGEHFFQTDKEALSWAQRNTQWPVKAP